MVMSFGTFKDSAKDEIERLLLISKGSSDTKVVLLTISSPIVSQQGRNPNTEKAMADLKAQGLRALRASFGRQAR